MLHNTGRVYENMVGRPVRSMWQYLRRSEAQAVIWVAIALALSVIAWYLVRKWRDQIEFDDRKTVHLTKFRELERQGVLSDAEFRTIKTALGTQLQDDLRNDLNNDQQQS